MQYFKPRYVQYTTLVYSLRLRGGVRILSNVKDMCCGFTETQTQITQCKINMYIGNDNEYTITF